MDRLASACRASDVSIDDAVRHLSLQNLVEEVKLMQHALHKYRMEFNTLEIRSRTVYKRQAQHLSADER